MAVEITRPHMLGKPEARRMVEAIAASLSTKLNLSYAWSGDRLTFKRTGVNGHIDVEDDAVHVFIKKGRLLPVSDAWIRQQVETTMDEYLT